MIAFLDAGGDQHERAADALRPVLAAGGAILLSASVYMEVLVRPLQHGSDAKVDEFLDAIGATVVAVDREIARRAAHPRTEAVIAVLLVTDSMTSVKQLITRIDDVLHARLKHRAAAHGRSLNSLATEALEAAVRDPAAPNAQLRRRADEHGVNLVVAPGPGSHPAGRAALIEELRGLGPLLDELIDDDRGPRA